MTVTEQPYMNWDRATKVRFAEFVRRGVGITTMTEVFGLTVPELQAAARFFDLGPTWRWPLQQASVERRAQRAQRATQRQRVVNWA